MRNVYTFCGCCPLKLYHRHCRKQFSIYKTLYPFGSKHEHQPPKVLSTLPSSSCDYYSSLGPMSSFPVCISLFPFFSYSFILYLFSLLTFFFSFFAKINVLNFLVSSEPIVFHSNSSSKNQLNQASIFVHYSILFYPF